ncbi:MAG: hypothetical protein WAM60_11765 [Candidatus Promineifilaceae bacterium]
MNPSRNKVIIILGFLLLIGMVIVACSKEEPETVEVTRIVEVPVEVESEPVEVTREVVVEVPVEVENQPAVAVPNEEQWMASAHADSAAEAFNHWNEEDPAEIPESCAKCHSTGGFMDFLGADGSEFGVVDHPAEIGSTIECEACHNSVTPSLSSVVFPSGAEITGLGAEARCMQCHQGRASTETVNQSIADAGLAEGDEDTVSDDLGFTNIHYFAAAATQYGTLAMGGYEYEGKAYDAKFDHVAPYDTCVDCHNPHTLEVQFDECTTCHTNLNSPEDLVNIRMQGSLVDYDGDGNMTEGIYYEIETLRDMLYQAMQAYTAEVTDVSIVYDANAYPYFFADSDGDGVVSEGDERYSSWTPRLAKAAYNYQVSLKDPGRYAHGGKYIIELLYDSIEDINGGLSEPVDLSNARRIDHGHFAGSEEAFRHWDSEGEVPGTCSRCHSAAGLPLYITQGVAINQPTANGLNCATCHSDLTTFTRYEVDSVTFPSGAHLTTGDSDSNLCLNCHQGRESTVSVNAVTAGLEDDVVADSLRFLNVHYFAAGASLFGTDAKGAYEYDGQTYLGRNEHVPGYDTCTECHNTHSLEVEVQECSNCHAGVAVLEDLYNIRVHDVDYNGDGDVTEGIKSELDTMHDALLVAMQDYTSNNEGTDPIIYNPGRYPYFFADTNNNGELDGDEGGYSTWTPKLLRAAYNYQYVAKDPGGFAHNGLYLIQVVYDSLNDLGADTSGMTRP